MTYAAQGPFDMVKALNPFDHKGFILYFAAVFGFGCNNILFSFVAATLNLFLNEVYKSEILSHQTFLQT